MARKSPRRTVMAETDASTVGSLEHHGDDRVKKAQAKLDRARAEACARELRDFGHRDESKVKEAHALLRRLGVSVSAVREVGSHLTRRWAFDFSMADFLDLIDGKCDADLLLESGISLLELLEAVNCVLRDAIAEYRDPDDDFSQQITVLVTTEQFVLSATTQPEAKTTPETREWFAHQIIIAYINWKSAVSANEVLRASRLAARMFELRERLWWKFEHEGAALRSYTASKRLADQNRLWASGTKALNMPLTDDIVTEFKRLRLIMPSLSVRHASEKMAQRRLFRTANGALLGASAIRARLRKAGCK